MSSHHTTAARWRPRGVLLAATLALGACLPDAVAPRPDDASRVPAVNAPLFVRITPAAVHLGVGDTLTLEAEVRDRYGNAVQDLVPEWESTATAIVLVSPDGKRAHVVGVGAGEARILARILDVSAAASVSVMPPGS